MANNSLFKRIAGLHPRRSMFDLSYEKKFNADMAQLIPVLVDEVVPGDIIKIANRTVIRFQPTVAPLMHQVDCYIHYFFLANRLMWPKNDAGTDGWEIFITGGQDGLQTPTIPTWTPTSYSKGSLWDFIGLPVDVIPLGTLPVDFPRRMYNTVYNEYYRDEFLQAKVALTNEDILNINWEKDYFSSALLNQQLGVAPALPLYGDVPVKGIGMTNTAYAGSGNTVYETGETATTTFAHSKQVNPASADGEIRIEQDPLNTNYPNIRADLSNVTAANINDLRLAFALQRYEEARARYGSRYTEYLRYLGVRSSDARLQRPEYLGGGKQTIQFSEVLQTTPDVADPDVGVGNLKGHGIGMLRSNRYRKFFEEHGYIFSFISVKPRTMYVQGLARTWNRRTKEDFWQKELEHIGQQEILNKELYEPHASPSGVWGYQDRYDEYRRQESMVSGEFRTILDDWHMARIFASDPTLNASFVESNPTKRIYAEQTQHSLWIMANHRVQARRQLSRTGTSYIF